MAEENEEYIEKIFSKSNIRKSMQLVYDKTVRHGENPKFFMPVITGSSYFKKDGALYPTSYSIDQFDTKEAFAGTINGYYYDRVTRVDGSPDDIGLYYVNVVTNYGNMNFWAGCVDGSIMKSIDGGYAWSKILCDPNNGSIEYVYFINEKIGYAIGYSQVLFGTTDGGLTWKSIYDISTSTTLPVCSMKVITLTSGHIVFVAVNGGPVYYFTSMTMSSLVSSTIASVTGTTNSMRYTSLEIYEDPYSAQTPSTHVYIFCGQNNVFGPNSWGNSLTYGMYTISEGSSITITNNYTKTSSFDLGSNRFASKITQCDESDDYVYTLIYRRSGSSTAAYTYTNGALYRTSKSDIHNYLAGTGSATCTLILSRPDSSFNDIQVRNDGTGYICGDGGSLIMCTGLNESTPTFEDIDTGYSSDIELCCVNTICANNVIIGATNMVLGVNKTGCFSGCVEPWIVPHSCHVYRFGAVISGLALHQYVNPTSLEEINCCFEFWNVGATTEGHCKYRIIIKFYRDNSVMYQYIGKGDTCIPIDCPQTLIGRFGKDSLNAEIKTDTEHIFCYEDPYNEDGTLKENPTRVYQMDFNLFDRIAIKFKGYDSDHENYINTLCGAGIELKPKYITPTTNS